ncbi:MAG: AAA family ATPase, partial [Gemmatimonadota bacterium]
MPSHHYLSCLGQPVLLGPDGEPIRFRTRKHFGLLIYLAVEPSQSHRRQRLAELLWPRSGEAEARHSVATAISMFRNRLGPRSIQADRDNVRLTLDGLVLDLARLSRGEVLGDEVTPPLEIGNFLDDFELDDAPEFMLWRNRQQTRLFPAIREGLMLLIDRCRRTGNFRQIEVLADRLLAIDHLSEDGVRAKMEARAFDGDRLSALRIFEDWRGILSEELGAQPSTRIEGIALRLRRRGWERSESIEIPTVPTDHWRGHRFIGRAGEYRAVYECWEQSARRSSRNVLLLGDSGVGKTTISDRLITAAGLEGAVTVRIQCYELDREIPYGALAGLVRGLLSRPGSTGTRPAALADLSVCIPEIRQRYPDLPQRPFADGEGVRVQLAEGAHELLSAVAEESPVILVVDDLHLADDASIAVLHLVLRRIADQPIMLMLTARPSELERSPSARRIREGSEALRLRTVDVPPMSEEESRELLAALLEGATTGPNAAERRAFLAAAAGYPMVLELFVRDWLAHGHRAMPLTLGAMTADLSQAEAAEHTYKALIDRMIHELPTEVRSVLNLAAVLGNRLNDLEMYGLVDLTLARTMTGMTALNDLRLLRDNGHDLGFRNELIRAQAYMNVPSTLRRALHARVAQRLMDGLSEQPPTGLELAWHCFRAGRTDEGQKYLLTGAREAIDEGAVCEAELAL